MQIHFREFHDDWDFSKEGRLTQAHRMSQFDFGILDFVCPLEQTRNIVDADYIIWMDTIDRSRFEDTNDIFQKPEYYDIRITEWIGENQLRKSLDGFNPGTNEAKVFKRGLEKTGQVIILLREQGRN